MKLIAYQLMMCLNCLFSFRKTCSCYYAPYWND